MKRPCLPCSRTYSIDAIAVSEAAFRLVISFRKTVSDQRVSERTVSDLQRVVAVESCEDSESEEHLYTDTEHANHRDRPYRHQNPARDITPCGLNAHGFALPPHTICHCPVPRARVSPDEIAGDPGRASSSRATSCAHYRSKHPQPSSGRPNGHKTLPLPAALIRTLRSWT